MAQKDKPYEKERLEMVAAEINSELSKDVPNWTYLDLLRAEHEYWVTRQPTESLDFYSLLFKPFGGF